MPRGAALRVQARRMAQELYWYAWRMPGRLTGRVRRVAREHALRQLIGQPQERMRRRLSGAPAAAEPKLDLFDDASAAAAAGRAFRQIHWPPVEIGRASC